MHVRPRVVSSLVCCLGVLAVAACAPSPAPQPQPAPAAAPATEAPAPSAAAPAKPAPAPAPQKQEAPAQPPPAAAAKPAAAGGEFRPAPDLLAAARQEGQVAFYSALPQAMAEEVKRRFEARTGVRLELTRLSAGPQRDRLLREKQSGLRVTDVIEHGNASFWIDYKRRNILERYAPDEAKSYRPEFRDKDGFFLAAWFSSQFIAYNPQAIAAAEAPRRWIDATDTKWQGKLSIAHPKHSGVANEFALAMVKRYGWEFYEKIKANRPLVVRSLAEMIPALVGGERPVAFEVWDVTAWEAKKRGSPIEFVYPEEGTMLSLVYTGVVKDPPHPSAARLLIEYLSSQEHQQFLADRYQYAPRADVRYPSDMRPFSELKLLTVDPEEVVVRQEEINEKFADLFGG